MALSVVRYVLAKIVGAAVKQVTLYGKDAVIHAPEAVPCATTRNWSPDFKLILLKVNAAAVAVTEVA